MVVGEGGVRVGYGSDNPAQLDKFHCLSLNIFVYAFVDVAYVTVLYCTFVSICIMV